MRNIKDLLEEMDKVANIDSMEDETGTNEIVEEYNADNELGLYIINTRRMYDKYCQPALDKIRAGKGDEVDWKKIAIEGARMYAREIEPLHLDGEGYKETAEYLKDYYTNLAGDPVNEDAEIEPGDFYGIAVKELPAEDIDHHESDLYIRKTPKSTELINRLKYKDANVSTFRSNIEPHDIWYDLPFCYTPHFEERQKELQRDVERIKKNYQHESVDVDMQAFLDKFNAEYKFLYDNEDNVAGADEAVDAFDGDMTYPKFKQFVQDFVQFRGDFISSDREAAAFEFACESFGLFNQLLEEKEPCEKCGKEPCECKMNEVKAVEPTPEVKAELERIKGEIEKESISYGEIAYLQDHQAEIRALDDIELAQWAGIPEEEWFSESVAQGLIEKLDFLEKPADMEQAEYKELKPTEIPADENGKVAEKSIKEEVEEDELDAEQQEELKKAIDLYKKHGMLFLDDEDGKNAYDVLYNAGYTMKNNGDVAHCIELNKAGAGFFRESRADKIRKGIHKRVVREDADAIKVGDYVKLSRKAKAEGKRLFGDQFQYGNLEGEVIKVKKIEGGNPNLITVKQPDGTEEEVAETHLTKKNNIKETKLPAKKEKELELIKYYKDRLPEFLNDYYFDNAELQDKYEENFLKTNARSIYQAWSTTMFDGDYDEWNAAEIAADKVLNFLERGSKSAKLGESNIETLNKVHNIRKTNARNAEIAFRNADDELTAKKMAVYQKNYFDPKKSEKEIAELNAKYDGEIEQLAKEKAVADAKLANNKKLMANRKVESFASLNAKLEAHLNETLSNWEDTYLPGTVNAIRLIAPVKFEGIDQQVVAYIFKNKEQFSHKFGYELTIENGGGSSIISNGDSDFANEAVDLCLTAIKEFDKENNTDIIYDVRPLEPSAEDIKYLNGEELKEDANLKPSIAYDDREGKYVCFATENGGAVKYTDTKEDAEQFLIDKYGVKKEDIELIESFEDKKVNFMNKLLSYDVDNSDKNMLIITVGKGELKDSQGTPYYIQATRLKKGNDTRNRFMAVYDDSDDSVRLDDAEYIDCTQADFVNLNGMVDDELNCLNEAWSDAELAQVGAITEKPTKKYRIYQNGGGEIAVTTHTLNGIWALMDESDDFDYIDDRMNDDWSDANWTLYDEELLNDKTAKEYFPMERYFADDENDLEYYHIYDLSQYYADKNESMNEVDKDKAEENNAKRQFNSLKADLKAEVTGDPKDQEEANKLANKATKSNKQLKSWKKAKYGESVDNFEKYAPNKDALEKCIKEGDIDGIKKIIKDQKTRFNWAFGLDKKKQAVADLDIIYKAIEDASTKEIDYDEEENLKGELEQVEKYMNDILNKDFTKEDKSTKAKYLGIRKGKKKKSAVKESADEVVARFDEGKHEIVKCSNGYYNRYNIKDGKARFTTKCVESLPTALGALKKRFPKAEEVKEEK